MLPEYRKALIYFLGDSFEDLSPDGLVTALIQKGFELDSSMTLRQIFEAVYSRYLKEKIDG